MKRFLMSLAAVGLALFAQADEWGTVVVTGTSASGALDLSDVWDIRQKSDVKAIRYSSDGWDLTTTSSGRSVTLLQIYKETETTVVEGLTGVGTYVWSLDGLQRKTYTLQHRVFSESTEVTAERLSATFDFSRCSDIVVSDEEMIEAVKTNTQPFTVANDATHPWYPIDGPGDGITAPDDLGADVASAFEFNVNGQGRFSFSHVSTGDVRVFVDGVEVKALAAADWTADSVETDAAGDHVVRFVLTGTGVARLKIVSWICSESYLAAEGTLEDLRFNLQTGLVLMVSNRFEMLPTASSSTNFTGLAGTDATSIARVTMTPLVGDGTDYENWTPQPEKAIVLVSAPGERYIRWTLKCGVWKALFEITTGGATVYAEERILVRQYGNGMTIFYQ